MLEASTYSKTVTLPNGRTIEIRALRDTDHDDFVAALRRTSDLSLYRRFFGPRRRFTEKEVASFVDIDFASHVALIAVTQEGDRPTILGAGRYVLLNPEKGEMAFTVVDDCQGQGIGTALARHLAAIAEAAGIKELAADVLAENPAMLKVFQKIGFPLTMKWSAGVVHIALRLAAEST